MEQLITYDELSENQLELATSNMLSVFEYEADTGDDYDKVLYEKLCNSKELQETVLRNGRLYLKDDGYIDYLI